VLLKEAAKEGRSRVSVRLDLWLDAHPRAPTVLVTISMLAGFLVSAALLVAGGRAAWHGMAAKHCILVIYCFANRPSGGSFSFDEHTSESATAGAGHDPV
jgi:hypothetical protein